MASPHDHETVLLTRGDSESPDFELLETIARRLGMQTVRFTGPEYAAHIQLEALAESIPTVTSALERIVRPAPRVEEIQRREDFLVRETFDDFNRRWLNEREQGQTVGRAFNDLVDIRPSHERTHWESGRHGGRYIEIGEPKPHPILIVKPRSEVGIEAYIPSYGSVSSHSFRVAALAIQAGSLVDLANEVAVIPANTAPAREFISDLIRQISTQIDF